jgi:hypothetical protein
MHDPFLPPSLTQRERKSAPSQESSGGGKLWLLLLVLAAIAGLYHSYLLIERSFWKQAIDRAVSDAMDTQLYIELREIEVEKMIRKNLSTIKNPPKASQFYLAIGSKDALALPTGYEQEERWQGHLAAYKVGISKAPGCHIQDATPPDLTLKSLARGGSGDLMDRAKGVIDQDPQAVLGLQGKSQIPPIYFVVDALFTFQKGWLQSRHWFHRRCFFYAARRPYREHPHGTPTAPSE